MRVQGEGAHVEAGPLVKGSNIAVSWLLKPALPLNGVTFGWEILLTLLGGSNFTWETNPCPRLA